MKRTDWRNIISMRSVQEFRLKSILLSVYRAGSYTVVCDQRETGPVFLHLSRVVVCQHSETPQTSLHPDTVDNNNFPPFETTQ